MLVYNIMRTCEVSRTCNNQSQKGSNHRNTQDKKILSNEFKCIHKSDCRSPKCFQHKFLSENKLAGNQIVSKGLIAVEVNNKLNLLSSVRHSVLVFIFHQIVFQMGSCR